MAASPEWKRANERLRADITRVAMRHGLRFRDLNELTQTNERYPQIIPVLVDWVRNTEARSGLADPDELHVFRQGLYSALTTIDSVGTEVVPLLMDCYYLEPAANPWTTTVIGDALKYLALSSDYPRMRELALDRSLSFGRASVLEWLIQQRPSDAVPLAVGELSDLSVRPYILRELRRVKNLPVSLRAVVEPFVDDPDSEVRLQAKRLLAHLDKPRQPPRRKPGSA